MLTVGRGTLLAGLLIEAEGLGSQAAIKAVRSRYCQHAVESQEQEDMLATFAGEEVHQGVALSYGATRNYVRQADQGAVRGVPTGSSATLCL